MRNDRFASMALCLFVILIPIASATTRNLWSGHNALEVQELLKLLNKPPFKSIQSLDRDIIDCILINQQPAFDHPRLKNHIIQMRPSSEPKGQIEESNLVSQLWHTVNETCPDGTVPIRRTKEEDLLRANSLEDFWNKFKAPSAPRTHEYGVVVLEQGKAYYGAKAVINVWSPQVVHGELSLAQMWISAGSFQQKNLNTMEVGWQIYPGKYGDSRPRLFTYWTSSTYGSTGCYNLQCPGFVQVSKKFVVGGTVLKPLSTYGGTQYSMTVQIWKDNVDKKWWLKLGPEIVGYWPASIFTSLALSGDDVQFGGEVVHSSADKQHTVTQMGSGHFAEEGFGKAAHISKIQFVDSSNNLQDPDSLTAIATHPNCYNVMDGKTAELGSYLYYGGPGRNPNCP